MAPDDSTPPPPRPATVLGADGGTAIHAAGSTVQHDASSRIGPDFAGAQAGDIGIGNAAGGNITHNISGIDGKDALAFIREYIVLLDQARNRVDDELRAALKDALAELARLGRDVAAERAALLQQLWITRLLAVVAMVTAIIAIGLALR